MSRRTAPVALGLLLAVAGCGNAATQSSDRPGGAATPRSSPAATSVPSGDPGVDASAVPDPGKPTGDSGHDDPARTSVPLESMLDSTAVSGTLGGRWEQRTGGLPNCADGIDGVAERTIVYRSAQSEVRQTLVTHASLRGADREVAAAGRRFRACGWTVKADPRLGSASTAASGEDGWSAVVVAADGVTVTLVGSGTAVASRARWASLVDIALGNACAAASDGCH